MQINQIETSKQVKLIDFRSDVLRNTRQKYILTEKGISDLTDDSKVYSSVGRMFALSNVSEIRDELKSNQEKCDDVMKQLGEKKLYLVKSLKEQEDQLRELVKQKQATK